MPIYEYLCDDCGLKKEYLQKMTDAPVAQCPQCGGQHFQKCLSAATVQQHGSSADNIPLCQRTGQCNGCGQ